MAGLGRSSTSSNILHRLVSRADAREALAWFVLVALAFPPWRAFQIEGAVESWELEAWPYAVMVGIAVIATGTLIGALRPRGKTTPSGQSRAGGATVQPAIARSAWLVILCSTAYAVAVGQLGFLLASPLFIAAVIFVLGSRHWPTIVGAGLPPLSGPALKLEFGAG